MEDKDAEGPLCLDQRASRCRPVRGWKNRLPEAVTVKKTCFFSPSESEQIVTLSPPLQIHGAVIDANTGKPIPTFKVTPGTVFKGTDGPSWNGFQTTSFADGQYEMSLESERDPLLLHIEVKDSNRQIQDCLPLSEMISP